ncbi:MAG TPA: hypothetical protein VI386_28460 [Candidatus Sulfotelmatobacter sp.]
MDTFQTLLRLGIFMLLTLPVVQCQVGASTLPTAAQKAGDAAAAEKAAAQKTADATADAAKSTSVTRLENARVDAIDSDYKNVSLTDCVPGQPDPEKILCNGKVFHLKVNDLALRAKVKPYHPGDHVRVDIKGDNELQDILGAWHVPAEGTCVAYRLLVLTACAFVILLLAIAVTKGHPLKFIISVDNRYSNSQLQITVWFWVVMSTYLATVVFRVCYAGWDFLGGVNIPQNLLLLSGLSAITYGGAKAITTSKVNAAMNPAPVAVAVAPAPTPAPVGVAVVPGPTPAPAAVVVTHAPTSAPVTVAVAPAANPDPKRARPAGQESFFEDLVKNDYGQFDFGDFQMIVVTFLAVGMYMTLIFHFLGSIEFLKTATLPDVDTTILAGFGLGQGAYLAKKAGGNVGTS